MAVKEAHAFKFADRAQLYFNCQIQIAVKEPNAQCPVIFTIIPCPEKILIDPRKKHKYCSGPSAQRRQHSAGPPLEERGEMPIA